MSLLQRIANDEILNIIKTTFDSEVYLVGGAVRDFALDKDTFDRDLIVCDECAREFSLKLSEKFDATFVPLDEVNKIYRLVFKDKINYLDITNPIENSLMADLKRRDLTMNSVAVNLKTLDIADPNGGLNDLKNHLIRSVSEQNFIDDPLRLLRVFRFQANLGFNIAPETLSVVEKHLDLISKPAVERKVYEIVKLFSGDYSHIALLKMDECGLLQKLFPIIEELKQVPPNSHHHLDLFNHSVETVKQITKIYLSENDEIKTHLQRIDFGGLPRIAHLRLAGFLHDIGKFSTWTIEEGRHRFIKHDDVGAKIALNLLKEMHFSNKQIDYITQMIKYHIYPSQVMSAPEITDKILMRYIRRMGLNSIDNVIIAKADRLSARGPEITDEIVDNNISALNRLQQFYIDNYKLLEPLPKLLSGNDVMNILKIQPSPLLGEILDALYEAQLNGDIKTAKEAVQFVKNYKI
ncbi:HD domain-containing protein [bacterium]|nr:HD domain-containing protein [bacterium]